MNTFIKLAKKRYSCREYSSQVVPKDKLHLCIEAARLAPSACNAQPWRFIVAHSHTAVGAVASCVCDMGMNAFAQTSPAFIVVLSGSGNVISRGGGALIDRDYRPIDIGIAAAQICLCAADIGLDTCIMGWINKKKLRKVLKYSSNLKAELVIAIGYGSKPIPQDKRRKDISRLVKFI